MNGDENKKSSEALPDEALENVAGGARDKLDFTPLFACRNCHDSKKATRVYLVKNGCVYDQVLYCDDCAKDLGLR